MASPAPPNDQYITVPSRGPPPSPAPKQYTGPSRAVATFDLLFKALATIALWCIMVMLVLIFVQLRRVIDQEKDRVKLNIENWPASFGVRVNDWTASRGSSGFPWFLNAA